jgi:hypothetical protein
MKSCQLGNQSFHVHLDGYNLRPYFKGEMKESPRKEFLYWSDDGDLFAIRVMDWKISFIEQYHEGLDKGLRQTSRATRLQPSFRSLRAGPEFISRRSP